MKILEELKQGAEGVWDSVAEGWRRLRESAAGALTPFRPGKKSLPAQVHDDLYLPSPGWALLAGDLFEDNKKVVVRLEVPGMEKGISTSRCATTH